MEDFEIQIGPEQRKLTLKPVANSEEGQMPKKYKIFDYNRNEDWLSNLSEEDVPAGNELGEISVVSEKDFTFNGNENFSGNDLLAIAAQIVRHPSFE